MDAVAGAAHVAAGGDAVLESGGCFACGTNTDGALLTTTGGRCLKRGSSGAVCRRGGKLLLKKIWRTTRWDWRCPMRFVRHGIVGDWRCGGGQLTRLLLRIALTSLELNKQQASGSGSGGGNAGGQVRRRFVCRGLCFRCAKVRAMMLAAGLCGCALEVAARLRFVLALTHAHHVGIFALIMWTFATRGATANGLN